MITPIVPGMRAGEWTVVGNKPVDSKYLCRCSCGTEKYLEGKLIRRAINGEPNGAKRCRDCHIKWLSTLPHPPRPPLAAGFKKARLTLLEYIGPTDVADRTIRVRCDCGIEKELPEISFRRPKDFVQSCGCLRDEVASAAMTKMHLRHGDAVNGARDPIWQCWHDFRNRVNSTRPDVRSRYADRGIDYDPAWECYETFRDYVLTNLGPHPGKGYSLDRIDNNKGYWPGNIRWATRLEQSWNSRTVKMLTYNGRTMPQAAWAREFGIPAPTFQDRIKRGWTIEQVLNKRKGVQSNG